MAHPLRFRIIRLCLHEALTNKEIADRLDMNPATTLHHVRLLVRTGFLEAEAVRSGARGALEKPYRTTGKSWVLSPATPDDALTENLAVIEAFRQEVLDAGPGAGVTGARMGLRLSTERAEALADKLREIVAELAEAPNDPDGERYGLFIQLHRSR